MSFGSSFGRTFSPPFHPKSQAKAGGDWWLAGGIDPANCIAAYQPKRAASYAASLVNLANPGTNNATEGNAPDWDATNGWKFNGANADYLILPGWQTSYTIICRYSNAASATGNGVLFGNSLTMYYMPIRTGDTRTHVNGTNNNDGVVAGSQAAGIVAIANNKAYFNGSDLNVTLASGTGNTNAVYLGRLNYSNPLYMNTAYVQALVIYNATLTSTQVGNLTTAMNAL